MSQLARRLASRVSGFRSRSCGRPTAPPRPSARTYGLCANDDGRLGLRFSSRSCTGWGSQSPQGGGSGPIRSMKGRASCDSDRLTGSAECQARSARRAGDRRQASPRRCALSVSRLLVARKTTGPGFRTAAPSQACRWRSRRPFRSRQTSCRAGITGHAMRAGHEASIDDVVGLGA